MGEADRLTVPETLRKSLVTVAALAATCGAVWLMRGGARALVESSGFVFGSRSPEPAEPGRAPAARVYDLASLVPETLRINAGGIAIRPERRILQMPYEMALEVSEAEARSAGWEPLELPLALAFAHEVAGERVYLKPDRTTAVCRALVARKDGTTRCDDFVIPLGDVVGLKHELTLDEIAARRGDLVGGQLPDVVREVVPGRVLYTQFSPHAEGAGFLVTTLSTAGEASLRRDVARTLRRCGWTRGEGDSPVWTKQNLSAVFDIRARGDAFGSLVTARFSDDEVVVSQKGNEEQ